MLHVECVVTAHPVCLDAAHFAMRKDDGVEQGQENKREGEKKAEGRGGQDRLAMSSPKPV
jgi:hypothetical protein